MLAATQPIGAHPNPVLLSSYPLVLTVTVVRSPISTSSLEGGVGVGVGGAGSGVGAGDGAEDNDSARKASPRYH